MSKSEEKRSVGEGENPPSAGQKRPYRRPELRRLGSVAELTLSGGQTSSDGRGTSKPGG